MSQTPERIAVYKPDLFEVADLEQAKAVIVTGESGVSSAERWRTETPYLVADVAKRLGVGRETRLLDYGCGIGRIAKELIVETGCRVIGIDASRAMRDLAPGYVLSERFNIWSPEVLEQMIARGFRVDCVISLWVVQHVLDVPAVIRQIASALEAGGRFYALNQKARCIPSDLGWVNDGFDVWSALTESFVEEHRYFLPDAIVPPVLWQQALVQILRRPDSAQSDGQ